MELLPCPFCGSTKTENWASRPRDLDYDIWCVFCHDCSCEGPESKNAQEAEQLWNKRFVFHKSVNYLAQI